MVRRSGQVTENHFEESNKEIGRVLFRPLILEIGFGSVLISFTTRYRKRPSSKIRVVNGTSYRV